MSEASQAEPLEKPGFRPDRAAGVLMLAFFFTALGMGGWSIYTLSHNEFGRILASATSPATRLATFVGFATEFWYSIGVFKGRRWAFVIAALHSAQKLVPLALYFPQSDHSFPAVAFLPFSFAVFLYCGLRALGKLGPREDDRLDLGEEENDTTVAFPPDRVAGGLLAVFRTGLLLWGLIDLGGRWLRAMPRTSLTLPEWMGVSRWSWLFVGIIVLMTYLWVSLGILRGRAWAFLLGSLLLVQRLLDVVGERRSSGSLLHLSVELTFGFSLAFFLYCGLRTIGSLGPRTGDRFALRDL